MSDVTLPTARLTAAAVPAAASAAPGTISDPPATVRQLALGSYLQGTVMSSDEPGQLLIRTELGSLPITTKAQLAAGTQVTVQLRSSGSQLHVVLMQVEGKAVAKAAAASVPPASEARPAPLSGQAGPSPAPLAADPGALRPVPGTVANPPPAAARLADGAILVGQALGRDAGGQLLVRTELGILQLATNAEAAAGAQVKLVVRSVIPQLSVLVTASDGPAQSAPPATTVSSTAVAPATAVAAQGQAQGSGHAAANPDMLTLGQSLRATLQGPSPAAPGAVTEGPTAPGGLAPGSQVELRVLQVSGAASAQRGQSAAKGLATAKGPAGAAGVIQPMPSATASGPQSPQAGTAGSTATAVAPSPPTPSATTATTPAPALSTPALPSPAVAAAALLPAAPPDPGALQITGLVSGSTPSGQPLVQTELGTLSLAIKAALPAGTRLVLELPAGSGAPTAIAAAPPLPDATALAYTWPALQELMELLEALDPVTRELLTAPQSSGPSLPHPGPRLGSALLFFITALNGGDPGAWLERLAGGRAAKLLEQAGRLDLLGRLKGDLGQLARLPESLGSEWRLTALPFFDGQQLQQLRFFVRGRPGGRSGGAEGDEATRFVLDVELTRLGELQLDGLVRPERFDLILRSRRALPDWMRRDIGAIFEEASAIAGSRGQVAFQASTDWHPMPVEAAERASPGLVV